jgi:hypothetical protein
MWEIESLKSACEQYIAVKSNIDQLSDNEAISALESIANLTMKKSAAINLIERLAPIGFDSICRIGKHGSMPNKVRCTVGLSGHNGKIMKIGIMTVQCIVFSFQN